MTAKIDFNCDMGESFGMYKMGFDEEVIKHITSANIACGFHAGDPMWMRHTVDLALRHGVAIGAHPELPRPQWLRSPQHGGIGRTKPRTMSHTRSAPCRHSPPTKGSSMSSLIGAMYNMAVNDESLAQAICESILEIDPEMILVALAGSRWLDIAEDMGLKVAREIFADRALNADGTLVSRSQPGSVIHDTAEVVERSLRMVTEGKATAITGEQIDVQADSLCLHGDTPGAVEMAASLKRELEAADVEILPLARILG